MTNAPSPIGITAEPIDQRRCKFLVDRPVHSAGLRRFGSIEEATGSPLAEALFAIPGITEIVVSGNLVTLVKDSPTPWQALGKSVGQAIRSALTASVPPIAERASSGAPRFTDDELYERVHDLFEQQVNPMVARHGGMVELIDVQDAVVLLRMGGGCQGCGMASVTLRQGIEGMLNQFIPEVKGIVDITDHGSGTSPYYAEAKK
jgi:Fe-S cluster biogenesis protein NfuA